MKNSDFGRKLKNIRSRRGLSQNELASRAGITRRTVQRAERGAVRPQGDTLRRMARALDVDVEEFTGVVDPPGRAPADRRVILFHLSPLTGLLIPFAQILAPLSMWLVYRGENDALNGQVREVLAFHGLTTLLVITGLVLRMRSTTAGLLLIGATVLTCTALTLWNAYRLSANGSYAYFPRRTGVSGHSRCE